MQDPPSQNITGSKVETHQFVHEVHWGQVILGFAVLAVVYAVILHQKEGSEEERR
jgi:hypothetical protein